MTLDRSNGRMLWTTGSGASRNEKYIDGHCQEQSRWNVRSSQGKKSTRAACVVVWERMRERRMSPAGITIITGRRRLWRFRSVWFECAFQWFFYYYYFFNDYYYYEDFFNFFFFFFFWILLYVFFCVFRISVLPHYLHFYIYLIIHSILSNLYINVSCYVSMEDRAGWETCCIQNQQFP